MTAEILFVGYTCPLCGSRVAVFRSSDPLEHCPAETVVECKCGDIRRIGLEDIQLLEVWNEKTPGN